MIILASSSPRRKEILKELGIPFESHKSHVEEITDLSLSPAQNAEKLAIDKAKEVAQHYKDRWVLGVDTIVVIDGKIIGKPRDDEEEDKILQDLSGRSHEVISGIALVYNERVISSHETTEIEFSVISHTERERYVASGIWKDKSGGFTIQGRGSLFIKGIKGDYYNVVGLPIYRFGAMCREAGLEL